MSVNREKLKELKKIALSSQQLQENTNKHIPILRYPDIYGKSLNKLLKNGAFILLYMWGPSYGHWCCVIDHPEENAVEFFDPYGEPVDYWLSKNTHKKNVELGQAKPYLLNKVKKGTHTFYYNPVKLQDESRPEEILTCGRWILLRIRNRHLSLDDFIKGIKDVKSKKKLKSLDKTAAYLTRHIDEQH